MSPCLVPFWAVKENRMTDLQDLEPVDDDAQAHPAPRMRALLEEFRRRYPALRTGSAPRVEPPNWSPHPLMDALLAEYRKKGRL
jgi:hypothetical protein